MSIRYDVYSTRVRLDYLESKVQDLTSIGNENSFLSKLHFSDTVKYRVAS